jgi:cobalamin biosynthesis protein CobC
MDQAKLIGDEALCGADLDSFTYHGGNLGAARRLYPKAPTPWIDLSTGINPHAFSLPEMSPEAWTRLPDDESRARLEAIAARRYGAADAGGVIAASGTQLLIQLIALLFRASRVGILGAAYSGHERAWRGAGARFASVATIGELAGFDVAAVVNPNNPDGRLVGRADLIELHSALAGKGGMLIVDEAFIDLSEPGASLAPALPASGTIVLRSFGKTYGLAGLRLGFAIASADLAGPLRAALGQWPVSGPAIAIGAAALGDADWLERMRPLLADEARRLDELLVAAGGRVLGGTSLFRLIAHPDAPQLFRRMLRHGVLARPFADEPGRLRFGLPGGEAEWTRLTVALAG